MPKIGNTLFKLFYRVLLKRTAHRTITGRNRRLNESEKGRFTAAEVNRIIDSAWRHFDELAPQVPAEPTIGAAHNARAACMLLCVCKALTEAGIDRAYAKILISDTLWPLYRLGAFVPRLISRILSRDPRRRIRICVKAFTFFPFGQPGYKYGIINDEAEKNAITIKWTRCPTIDYLRAHQAEDLCLECMCNLDYPLVEYWGGKFDRPCTQALGAKYCHMRFNMR